VTTALLFAAALTLEQAAQASPGASQPVAPPPAAQTPAAQPQATVVIPTAQPATQPPAAAQPAAVVPPPAVSTTPLDQLQLQSSVRPFEMPASAPAGPVPYAALDADVKAPVKVEDYHRTYEGPKDSTEAYYDAGVKGAFAAEQALHGRLDGIWIVSAADGSPLLSLVISDPGGAAQLGGAWRDLTRGPGPESSGVIDQVVREGEAVIVRVRLSETAPALTLRLQPAADGRWRGQLYDAGKARAVVMDRKAI
jgi:hypothetical protein